MRRDWRLLDGYIGILGFILHYKVLAWYSVILYVFDFSLRLPWVGYVFHVGLDWLPSGKEFQFSLQLGNWLNRTTVRRRHEADLEWRRYKRSEVMKLEKLRLQCTEVLAKTQRFEDVVLQQEAK